VAAMLASFIVFAALAACKPMFRERLARLIDHG
jgi:hypothetical protein